MHVDLAAADREAEVARLVELGAKRVTDMDEWGYQWTVMQDPEGNEFCVAQPDEPRGPARPRPRRRSVARDFQPANRMAAPE
jgi:hypothetical protein